jgi:microcystin-dependent protein
LSILGNEENWEQVGSTTPEDIAQAFLTAFFETMMGGGCVNPGEVFWFAGTSVPDGALLCDGSSLLRDSYPALFAAIGTTWGAVDGDHFNIPDLINRIPRGVSSGNVATTGGASTVTLSTSEMPAHTHSVHTHLTGLAVAPGELVVTIPSILPGATGSAGGGDAHDNMPPWAGLLPCIRV